MREDVLVFHQHRHIVVVTEDRLELVGLEQHRVVAHEIVVERSFHHDALRSHKREGDDDCEQRTDHKPVAKYPVCQLLELTVDFYDFHSCFIFVVITISERLLLLPLNDRREPLILMELDTFIQLIGPICPAHWTRLSNLLDKRVQFARSPYAS